MNNEIKEILESLDKIAKKDYYPEDLLYYENCKILLDYITNLQEENERLKERATCLKDRFYGQRSYDDSYRITAKEYNRRIYEAIEVLNSYVLDEYDLCDNVDKAINILKGVEDEKE